MTKKRTLSGRPPLNPYDVRAPAPVNPATGMHDDYWVLTDDERAKGYVRPVRREYIHNRCNERTIMAKAIAETFARDPKFYGETYCAACRQHYRCNEFTWAGTEEVVGS